jgi:uncharacterized membrane protein SpoIIM required for sporulation
MREGMFIKRNVDKWNGYQHEQADGPDDTAERFVTLVDDLSYAKTFYPKSKATKWINSIAANIYQSLYKNRKDKYSRFFTFWKYELPFLFRRYHKILLFTFLLFASFTFIGVITSIKDEGVISGILGQDYVEETERNIQNKDPFGIYKDGNPFSMFVYIAVNNISFAFYTAIGGLTLGVLTIYKLWQTGIMLGSFHYMFFKHGVGMKSIMVIWIHGTLEILAIIISATAGFIIASGILFPGTYSRLLSFKRAVKDALKIMIVLVPVFIVAAFLETYVTYSLGSVSSNDDNKDSKYMIWVNAAVLVVSLLFIVWYFVIYPILLHRKKDTAYSKTAALNIK